MLELGLHPETPDIEAQQALKNAQRLLTKHNLQKADVLKGGLEANKHAFKAGMRIVELRSKDKLKPGRFEHWVYSLALIVSKYFDTQYFAQKHLVLKVVFYGIKQNVDCAGYAFAATFNRISKLSADYHPSKHENYKKARKTPLSNSTFSRVSRMSYRNGLVEGLFETVKSRKLHQKMNTKFGGMKSSELGKDSTAPCERDRLRLNRSDEDCWPDDAYNDCSGNEASSTEATRFDDEDDDICGVWSTDQSAVLGALVLHSKKIGDDLLKERKIKVANRRQESPIIWDGEAFLKGKRDSRTIDLGQKGITAKARKTAAV
ncbi:hypothetical protein KP509_02G003000 [Ceratopteris richardii]|nr:hypothetical protein KP509_02G003000 [Ceratopteris richardii]